MIELKRDRYRTLHQRTAGRQQLLLELHAQAIQRELIRGGHQQQSAGQAQSDTVAKP